MHYTDQIDASTMDSSGFSPTNQGYCQSLSVHAQLKMAQLFAQWGFLSRAEQDFIVHLQGKQMTQKEITVTELDCLDVLVAQIFVHLNGAEGSFIFPNGKSGP